MILVGRLTSHSTVVRVRVTRGRESVPADYSSTIVREDRDRSVLDTRPSPWHRVLSDSLRRPAFLLSFRLILVSQLRRAD